MAAGTDRLKTVARRVAGEVIRDAVKRAAAEIHTPPPLPQGGEAGDPLVAAKAASPPSPAFAAAAARQPESVATPTGTPAAGALGAAPFRSSIAYSGSPQASALVIACNSFLYLAQTLEFLERGLGLQSYDLIAVPGGIQWLALPDLLPKHHRVSRWAVEYLLRRHRIERDIGIAHQGWSAYDDEGTLGSLARLATGKTVAEHQRDHLARVGRDLRAAFGVTVELYWAALEDGRTVVFQPLDAGP